jgi:hypothetical protein
MLLITFMYCSARGYGRKYIEMATLISLYKERLNLSEAQFTFIDHEDAMGATVFKVALDNGKHLPFIFSYQF